MTEHTLSERLRAIIDLVPETPFAVDVGTDHAFVPLALIREGRCTFAVASDIVNGPLERARAHIEEAGLSAKIPVILSDGLDSADFRRIVRERTFEKGTLLIAGMGGRTTEHILRGAKDLEDLFDTLILQPQSDPDIVRHFLAECGFAIDAEKIVEEDGKYYTAMRAKPGKMVLSDAEALYGPALMKERPPAFLAYLNRQAGIREEILTGLDPENEKHSKRIREIKAQLLLIRDAQGETENAAASKLR